MRRVLILVMLLLALGCAKVTRADQIIATMDTAGDFGAATLGGASGDEVCVICRGGPSPQTNGSTANFTTTGISVDMTADYVILSPSSIRPDCDPKDPVPEPASMVLLGSGLLVLGAKLRRRPKA